MTDLLVLRLRSVSDPLDAGTKIELKFEVEQGEDRGELYLRVRAANAAFYGVGEVYAAHLVKVP